MQCIRRGSIWFVSPWEKVDSARKISIPMSHILILQFAIVSLVIEFWAQPSADEHVDQSLV